MKFGVLVRDKFGNPKFNRPEQIKKFAHSRRRARDAEGKLVDGGPLFTDKDWEYLYKTYGPEWIDLDRREVRK